MKLDKLTKRYYDDACATAHALDLVGERWALLVIRELMIGPKRFGDLKAGLPGISANTLTQRLESLEDAGVLAKRKLPPPANTQVYELTPWGYEAEPIFQTLGRWAARSPAHDPTLPFSAASLILSMRTMLDADLAAGIDARIGLSLGNETYLAALRGGTIQVARGSVDNADVVFIGAPAVIAGAIYGGQPLEALEAAGALTIEGNRALAVSFVSLFPLPAKAERPAR